MVEYLKKNERLPQKKSEKKKISSKKTNGRRPIKNGIRTQAKMEDDLKHNFKKSTCIGCDIIVN